MVMKVKGYTVGDGRKRNRKLQPYCRIEFFENLFIVLFNYLMGHVKQCSDTC
jgi:hypothetical protein